MIQFLDIQKINAQYQEELENVASETIRSGWYLFGKQVDQFEKSLARYIGTKYAVGVGNGLEALQLILRAYIEMNILQEGDEVLVPANTYIATILALTQNNLTPVLIEPDLNTYNIDTTLIEKHISNRTKAIMPVHLYGRVCWNNELAGIAKKYNLKIIEDNAQAIGAEWNKLKTGALGDAGAFSFYPGKNLGALGDAGAITTNDKELVEIVRALGNYGSSQKYHNAYLGYNSRLSELQAGFLNIKLKYINKENQIRREFAEYYIHNINNPGVILPETTNRDIRDAKDHVWHLFVIRHQHREKLQQKLKYKGVQTMIHYPIPPHKQKAYEAWNNFNYPVTERIHNEVLSLPLSPIMKKEELDMVIKAINSSTEE